jgi:hypothetical protein
VLVRTAMAAQRGQLDDLLRRLLASFEPPGG